MRITESGPIDPTYVECANCGERFAFDPSGKAPGPYCDPRCDEIAGTVRYVRSKIALGAWGPGVADPDADIDYAIRIRIAHVLGGGYDRDARRLSEAVRALVRERDAGLCVLCGARGEEIDHINGSSPDPANLRLLCRACHHQVTNAHLRPIQADDTRANALRDELIARFVADLPLRPCDVPEWGRIWRTWCRERREFAGRDRSERECEGGASHST